MSNIEKPIRLSAHAIIQSERRGASQEEVIDAIRTSEWKNSELDKMECSKDFIFNKTWNTGSYKTKQVRPIFVDETSEIVVVTVYVYYF